jgi:hypothetical protein
MPLATKNNALILKDGKIAENCGCCEQAACCTFFDWSAGGPQCSPLPGGGQCFSNNSKKISTCVPPPTYVSVSGLGEAVRVPGQCPLTFDAFPFHDKSLAVMNGTFPAIGVCGGTLTQVYQRDTFFQFNDVGLNMGVRGSFSPNRKNGQRCSDGFVCFKVQAGVSRGYPEGFTLYSIELQGDYESDCFSIDSLPSSGAMSAGRSAQITLRGSVIFQGSLNLCNLEPQTINVAFLANPLP